VKKLRFFHRIPLVLGLICLVFAAVLLSWRLIPGVRNQHTLTLPAGTLAITDSGKEFKTTRPVDIYLSWPAELKAGEEAEVNLRLSASQSQDEAGDYTHPIMAELAFVGLQQTPQGYVQTLLEDDHETLLSWQISTDQVGSYKGRLWISLGFADATGKPEDATLAAMELQTEVTRLWGMDVRSATGLGLSALLLWGCLMALSVWLEHCYLQG
jgi:hypothetical protein